MAEQPLRLRVANEALLDAPIYEKHQRGSNWCAVIDIDGTAPGGLSRRWLPRGKGDCFYMIQGLALFDAVEFGADYTTHNGNKRRDRWYGVVVAKTDGFLLVERAKDGTTAVLLAKDLRMSPEARREALLVEKQDLLDRAKRLSEEIEQMETPDGHS